MSQDAWIALQAEPAATLRGLFAAEPDRLSRLVVEQGGISFDFSKTHLSRGLIESFAALADQAGLAAARDALFAGDRQFDRGPGRRAQRRAGAGGAGERRPGRAAHARMRALIDAIEAEAFGPVRHILHIGIGGSALGPELLIDALGRDGGRYDAAILSNVDGVAFEAAVAGFDPAATLVAVASKTFTTTETMLNARAALQWLEEGGVTDPYGRLIALTASPDKAIAFGVDETRILPFSETRRRPLFALVVDRLPGRAGAGLGCVRKPARRGGGDGPPFPLHPVRANAPVLAAFVDRYYANLRGAETRGIFAYDERLRLLPSYLQQLEMESNGKSVRLDGSAGRPRDLADRLGRHRHRRAACGLPAAPPGHASRPGRVRRRDRGRRHARRGASPPAADQLLRPGRGPDGRPAERRSAPFLSRRPALDDDPARPARSGDARRPHRLLRAPHLRQCHLLGINPFDQFGVELGKEIAKGLDAGDDLGFDPSTEALIARAFGGRRPMTASYDYDLFVIGAGSGGVRAARVSPRMAPGRVAEEHKVGGTCVIRGCVPKKLLVYGAHFAEDLQDAAASAGKIKECASTGRPCATMSSPRSSGSRASTPRSSTGIRSRYLKERATVDRAAPGPLADGAKGHRGHHPDRDRRPPVIPNIPGAEHGITSNEMFHFPKMPKRVVIAGGGYIANEFAGIFHNSEAT
jgi:glucose-6-phosphate isomerase